MFPNIEVLFLNDNARLSSLERRADQDVAACLPKLKTLSLDNCPLGDWAAIGAELVQLPRWVTSTDQRTHTYLSASKPST